MDRLERELTIAGIWVALMYAGAYAVAWIVPTICEFVLWGF